MKETCFSLFPITSILKHYLVFLFLRLIVINIIFIIITGNNAFFNTITTTGGIIVGGGDKISCKEITCVSAFFNCITGISLYCNAITGTNIYATNNIYAQTGLFTNYGVCGGTGTFSYLNVGNTGYFDGFYANSGSSLFFTSPSLISTSFTGTRMWCNNITGAHAYFDNLYTTIHTDINQVSTNQMELTSAFVKATSLTGTNVQWDSATGKKLNSIYNVSMYWSNDTWKYNVSPGGNGGSGMTITSPYNNLKFTSKTNANPTVEEVLGLLLVELEKVETCYSVFIIVLLVNGKFYGKADTTRFK